MNKLILDKSQIEELVSTNKYQIDEKRQLLSRCIDGRYPNSEDTPALAIPGGDGGELALILATANAYGFEVDFEKAYQSLLDVIGGVKNFNFHTDDHHEGVACGCGHMAQIKIDPKAYQIEEEQVSMIFEALEKAKNQGAKETVLAGSHLEGAVLLVKGDYGVNPQYYFQTGTGRTLSQVFVFHETLVNARHRIWTKKMHENKAVKLYNNVDGEYLYEVLSEITEDHLLETAKRLAKGLPIYSVEFEKNGSFDIIPL